MVLGADTVVAGAGLFARRPWAWGATSAVFVVHSIAVLAFGLVGAMARGAGAGAYLGAVAVFALFVVVLVLLRTKDVKADLQVENSTRRTGSAVVLWSIVA